MKELYFPTSAFRMPDKVLCKLKGEKPGRPQLVYLKVRVFNGKTWEAYGKALTYAKRHDIEKVGGGSYKYGSTVFDSHIISVPDNTKIDKEAYK